MAFSRKKEKTVNNRDTDKALDTGDCVACEAACCRHVAVEIDKPTCKRDFDNVRWQLLHDGVHVFVDHDNEWYVEFEAKCDALQGNHL